MTTIVETQRYAPGTFCWAELQTSDGNAAKSFYAKLFGWTAQEDPIPQGGSYIMFSVGGKNVAAAYQMSSEMKSQGIPPHWGNYVSVDNVDTATKKAKDCGGKVIAEPMDVMESGRMAVLQDPTGAVVSLWQAKAHHGAQLRDELGAMCWHELMTNDTAKAQPFYTKLFSWTTENMEGDTPYTFFKNQDTHRESRFAGGMMTIPPDMAQVPPHWMVYFQVANCDATVTKVQELGGKVRFPATDIPPGRFALLQDLQGATFAVLQFKPQQPK